MHGAAQSGGPSPKTLNGTAGGAQVKPGSDSVQNSSSSLPSEGKGRKRELGVQTSDPVKRERITRAEDADTGQLRPEQMLKSEITKITDRGGLVDFESVEKLVQLMQPDSVDKKLDLNCRSMLATVISATDRFECLARFVQLRGLLVLDDWLQEVHKGKVGDGSSPKESDKFIDDFLLSLLRALDKLPVNLHALQTCNIGKSVNHLRSHKNLEIQKRARSLVDTWKKRVEAEMNIIDAKSGSSRGGSWPNKSVVSEVSNVSGRRAGGLPDPAVKGSTIQSYASKAQLPPGKLCPADKPSTASPGSSRPSTSATATSGVGSTKDLNSVALGGAGASDIPLTTIKEDKSSSSSQSLNNSQSCSSDYGKTVASREDTRGSTAGSMNVNKTSVGVSRNRKSSNGIHSTSILGVQKENDLGKFSSINRILSSDKVLPDVPIVDNGVSQRIIVRLPNTSRSPARSASGGSPEDVSTALSRGSPVAHSQKLEEQDHKVKVRCEALGSNEASNMKMDLSSAKDELAGCVEANVTSVVAPGDQLNRDGEGSDELTEASKATGSPSGITVKPRKAYKASFSSMNALIDSCVKFSEANATASVGDDLGMNLLASVAAGETSRSDLSPLGSPQRKCPVAEDSCSGNDVKLKETVEDRAQSEDRCNDESNGDAFTDQGISVNSLRVKPGVQHKDMHKATDFSGNSRVPVFGSEGKIDECSAQLNSSIVDLPTRASTAVLSSDVKLRESVDEESVAMSSVEVKNDVVGEGTDERFKVLGKLAQTRAIEGDASNSNFEVSSAKLDQGKTSGGSDDKPTNNGTEPLLESASTCAKGEAKANEESTSCSSSDRHDLKDLSTLQIAAPSGSCVSSGTELKSGKDDEMKTVCHTERGGEQKLDIGSSTCDHTGVMSHGNLENNEVMRICSSGPASIVVLPSLEWKQTVKPSSCKSDGAEEPSGPNHSSVAAVKLDFDLNEGFLADDGSSPELVKLPVSGNLASVCLPFPVPISVSSLPGSFSSSVTVTAAAKGSFPPPENPLRMKGELGWKGSAATSAFRPAEPRKITDMALGTADGPLDDNSSSKHGRPLLDFDLNVPDQRALEDVVSQNNAPMAHAEPGTSERSGGGLDLNLNRCDEGPEIAHFSVRYSSRSEMPRFPGPSVSSGGLSIAESVGTRGFDLNNGPGPDEVGNETAPHAKNGMPFLASVPTVRMNNMELGNFSSWFPPGGASCSAITMSPILQGRGEHSYPLLPASSSQRILGPPSGNNSFGPELFRGPVLSSSPAIGFPSNTPFQYPGFPFDTNFPLAANSYSGVSTPYADSSSGGPLCFPAIPSQLMGPNGVVSTQYSRPYVMSLPGGSNNIVHESRKWGSQGLDLNAGPGGPDLDRREERFPSALRPLSVSGSQTLQDEQMKMYQMVGGMLKRKEPDAGWDADRINYKQPSWQ